MKLEKLALFAEIFGAVAIVATLIVLIFEVRANTDAVKSQAAQNTFEASFSMLLDLTPEQLSAYRNFLRDGTAGVSDAESLTAEIVLTSALTTYDSHYYQYMQGNLDNEVQAAYARRLDAILSNPVVRDWWQESSFQFTDSFQTYVEGRLRALGANATVDVSE